MKNFGIDGVPFEIADLIDRLRKERYDGAVVFKKGDSSSYLVGRCRLAVALGCEILEGLPVEKHIQYYDITNVEKDVFNGTWRQRGVEGTLVDLQKSS